MPTPVLEFGLTVLFTIRSRCRQRVIWLLLLVLSRCRSRRLPFRRRSRRKAESYTGEDGSDLAAFVEGLP